MNSKIEINYSKSTYENKSLSMNHLMEYASRSLLSSGHYIITARSLGPGTPAYLVLVSIEIPYLAQLLKLKMTPQTNPNVLIQNLCRKNIHDGTPN